MRGMERRMEDEEREMGKSDGKKWERGRSD